jgi:uncharacterized protein
MYIDTGPLVALLDRNDAHHADCVRVLQGLPAVPLVTTWPCFTEAFYLLYKLGGRAFQKKLWAMRRANRLLILDATSTEIDRMEALMAQYGDVPMDLADASLVAVAEGRGYRKLFTLDSDFYVYRLADGSVLEVIK